MRAAVWGKNLSVWSNVQKKKKRKIVLFSLLNCYTKHKTSVEYRTFFKYQIICAHSQPIFNLLNPTGHVMHQQFNIQQLYVLPTLYLCVLYLSENKQRFVPLTA
jgi:hypothetical protein